MKLRLVRIHRKMIIEKGGSFMISIVVHDGLFTVISRVNICRVSERMRKISLSMSTFVWKWVHAVKCSFYVKWT